MIDETLPVKGSGKTKQKKGKGTLNIMQLKTVQRITRLVNTMTNAHDSFNVEAHKDEICRLPAGGYGTTEFDMSDKRLQALINAGRKAMAEYFNKHTYRVTAVVTP